MPNLTKSYVESRPAPVTGQAFYWDSSFKGFGVRVTAGSKTFILDRKLNGRTVRLTIGRYPVWSVVEAREHAQDLIVKMNKGIDPRIEKQRLAEEGTTLQQIYDLFMAERQLKPRTRADYARFVKVYFKDWMPKAISRIDADLVLAQYKKIAQSTSGGAQASAAMRFLRALFNFARASLGKDIVVENPVGVLSAKKVWLRGIARTDHLNNSEIGPFVNCLRKLDQSVTAAYLEFIVMTGARRAEAATLLWKDIDFSSRLLTFRDTKNHTDRTMPLTPHVGSILSATKEQGAGGRFVFSVVGKDGKPTNIKEPRKTMAAANKAANSAVTVHGLRRTFATLLESLDAPAYVVKALLGHSMKSDITTHHYVQLSVERLRPWLEKYEVALLRLVGDIPGADVVPLNAAVNISHG